ncbi:ECF RNA polymerase sigma factor SigK [Frondihabitans peucedani]|uniref:Sigma-70 family RNA polymerase sigma factor n=1 Tax=Frondihabitans peucedani TaxID=598626 RepID=A0ABP8E348_9MICO
MTLAPAPSADTPRSDDDLLLLTAEGNREAFTLLYDRTAARILGLVRRVLIDQAQSEEVTQDVFLEVWQNAKRFDPARGKALSWVLTIAHRRAIDRVRSSQSSRDRDYSVGVRDYEASRDDVAESVETRREHQRVTSALSLLTDHQRQALELTYYRGLTNVEAALQAGVPVNTMKSRLRDSLMALRRLVADAA